MTNAANPFAFQADTAADHSARALGLSAANANRWTEALLHLNAAARQGQVDLMVLDALGEAAYRTNVPEALGPYQNYYKYPLIASHMARAFLMLGDRDSCTEFLGWAKESALKSALLALLQLGEEISATAAHFFISIKPCACWVRASSARVGDCTSGAWFRMRANPIVRSWEPSPCGKVRNCPARNY